MRLLQELIWFVKLLHLTLVHHLQREEGEREREGEGWEERGKKGARCLGEYKINSLSWLKLEACL